MECEEEPETSVQHTPTPTYRAYTGYATIQSAIPFSIKQNVKQGLAKANAIIREIKEIVADQRNREQTIQDSSPNSYAHSVFV
jgi:hypothetical protein